MGEAWADSFKESRAVFDEADEALGFALSRLCWEGPEDELQLTANTQPAILATSVAIGRVLQGRGLRPSMVAGHSLGEYSAHVMVGTLEFADALRLVRRRGEFMQEAVPVGEGAMAAVLGLDPEKVAEVVAEAAEGEVCTIANLNAPGQIVIAGHRTAVERAVGVGKTYGARRTMLLPVSAPFHSPLMAPAREALTPLLEAASFADPTVPVVTNVDASPVSGGPDARDALIRQVDGPVRWIECVERMAADGADTFVEVGPGAVLSGLIRRISPDSKVLNVAAPESLDEVIAEVIG